METTCLYDDCPICNQILEEDKEKQKIPACLFALMLYTFSFQEECDTHEMMNKEIGEYQEEELTQSDIY